MELVLAACLTFTHWHVTSFTLNRNVKSLFVFFFFFVLNSRPTDDSSIASFSFLFFLFSVIEPIWPTSTYCVKKRLLFFFFPKRKFWFFFFFFLFFSSSRGEEENTHRAFLFAFQRCPAKKKKKSPPSTLQATSLLLSKAVCQNIVRIAKPRNKVKIKKKWNSFSSAYRKRRNTRQKWHEIITKQDNT